MMQALIRFLSAPAYPQNTNSISKGLSAMFNNLVPEPRTQKDLVEEHQRELLEEVERDRMAEDPDSVQPEDYEPDTDKDDTFLPAENRAEENRRVRGD
jgi:hypothetical protein